MASAPSMDARRDAPSPLRRAEVFRLASIETATVLNPDFPKLVRGWFEERDQGAWKSDDAGAS